MRDESFGNENTLPNQRLPPQRQTPILALENGRSNYDVVYRHQKLMVTRAVHWDMANLNGLLAAVLEESEF